MNILALKSKSSLLSKKEQLNIKGGTNTSNSDSTAIVIIDVDTVA